jgi:hypothetical protein
MGLTTIWASSSCSDGGGGGGGNGGGGGGGGSGGAGGQVGPIYDTCEFDSIGACSGGSCATEELEGKVYAAWRAKVLALSGLTPAEHDSRVAVSLVERNSTFVRIEYVVVLDWVWSRQVDSMSFADASSPPTDAEIQKAVDLGIEQAEWTSLGAIASVATEAQVKAAFDGCQSDITIDWCHIDFANVSGTLQVKGSKQINPAANECLGATVDVTTGTLLDCTPKPCFMT